MTVEGIAQAGITVTDVEAATTFYEQALGLRKLFATGGMAFFECGKTRLLLGSENTSGQTVILYFSVADIHESVRTMRQRGVTFDGDPHLAGRLPDREIWLASFTDPDRNHHLLLCEKPLGNRVPTPARAAGT